MRAPTPTCNSACTPLTWPPARPTRWAAGFDGSLAGYAVESKGGLLAPGMLGTATALYQQTSPRTSFQKLDGWPGTYAHIATAPDSSRIAFTYSEVDKPTEVYLADSADKLATARPITSFNKLFTERDLPRASHFAGPPTTARRSRACLLFPPGKFEAKNLRMFILIHGGPMDADGDCFGADWYDWAMSPPAKAGWSSVPTIAAPPATATSSCWPSCPTWSRAPAATSSAASTRW